MYCKNCGTKLKDLSNFCGVCGQITNNVTNNLTNKSNPKRDNSLISLIIGVISIIGSCIINILIIPLAIVGLIFGITTKQKSTQKTFGILLNILSIIVSIIILLAAIILLVIAEDDKTYHGDGYELDYSYKWASTTITSGDALVYKDKKSYLYPIGTSALTPYTNYLKCDFKEKTCQEKLYDKFYDFWSDEMKEDSLYLYKEKHTFKILDDDIYYATYNYGKSERDLRGKYYLIIEKDKDIILSFITNTTNKNVEKLNKEVLRLLSDIEIEDNYNNSSDETVIYDDELANLLDSLSNWNRYSDLRKGSLGKNTSIEGGWRILSDSNTYWKFKNNEFWWYESVDNLNDNYWYGTTEIITGKKGLRKAGIGEDRIDAVISKSKGIITENDIYTIICTPAKIIVDGQDKSSTNLPKNTTWTYVWIVVDHKGEGIEGQVINLNTYATSYYVKIKD